MRTETDAPESFPSTRWSQLADLGGDRGPRYRRALTGLIERYWRPAYGYLRNLRRLRPEEALELTQEFFARVLEKGRIGDLVPGRGSFRGYLKACLQNFTVSAARADLARRPREGRIFSFDLRLAPPSAQGTPEEIFDREWARDILGSCLRQSRDILVREGRAEDYDLFAEYYLEPIGLGFRRAETPERSHEALARKYRRTASEVNHRLRAVRSLLRRLLQERVAEYVGPGEDIEAELAFLLSL